MQTTALQHATLRGFSVVTMRQVTRKWWVNFDFFLSRTLSVFPHRTSPQFQRVSTTARLSVWTYRLAIFAFGQKGKDEKRIRSILRSADTAQWSRPGVLRACTHTVIVNMKYQTRNIYLATWKIICSEVKIVVGKKFSGLILQYHNKADIFSYL